MIYSGLHKEIHSELMQRKDPISLWDGLFENTWIGLVLSDHKDRDDRILNEILDFCKRQISSTTISNILKEERNIAALSLYAGLIFDLYKECSVEIQDSIKEKIIELDKKEKGKFSLFNTPEIFYSVIAGLAMLDMLKGTLKEILLKYAFNEIENWQHNKIYRFALYSASLFKLNVENIPIDNIINFLISINIEELTITDIIPLLWFIVKYNEDILKRVEDTTKRKLIEDLKEKLWDQFENQYNSYVPYKPKIWTEDIESETVGTYTLSTFELGMIDDILACQEKVYKIDPNRVFDLLQLHPIIKQASERLFKDGHYSQAILEAYKALINHVKAKSGINSDGTPLMTEAFKVDYDRNTLKVKQKPRLKLNELSTREDMDEQQGFMYLFMGAVMGIRNPKAHAIIEQKDPFKTLEYLSFASLLAKKVDESKLNNNVSS